MWIPAEIKALVDTLLAEIAAIKDAIQKYSDPGSKTQETESVKRSEIPGIIAAAINDNQERESARAEREKTHGEQERLITSQNRTATWTRNACIAAAAYGLIATWQGCMMWRTYNAIQDQNELLNGAQMDISTNDPFGEPATRVPIDATFDFVNVGHVSAHRFRAWVKSIAVYSFPEDRIIGTENPLPTGIERPLVLPPPASSLYQPIDRNRVPEWGFQFSDKIKHLITDQDVVLEVDIGISYNDGYKEVSDHICYAHMHIRGAPRANKVGVVEMFGESYETISCDSVSDRMKNLWALENSKSN